MQTCKLIHIHTYLTLMHGGTNTYLKLMHMHAVVAAVVAVVHFVVLLPGILELNGKKTNTNTSLA